MLLWGMRFSPFIQILQSDCILPTRLPSLTSATHPINPVVAPVLEDKVAVGSGPPRYMGSFRLSPTVLPGDVPTGEK